MQHAHNKVSTMSIDPGKVLVAARSVQAGSHQLPATCLQ